MHISNFTNNIQLTRAGPKVDYEFQALGIEMQEYFKTKAVWSIFYRAGNTESKIRDAFKICKERGVSTFPYLLGVLKKLK